MPAGDIQLFYPAASDITFTVASLVTDANLLSGRQSNAVSNLTTRAVDYLLSGRVTTGTSPTAGRIEVWAVASWDGTNWPDAFTASDANRAITTSDIKNSICVLVASMNTDATSRAYHFAGVSIAARFGGVVPPAFALFVVHNTVVALSATGHQFRLQPVLQTVSPW